jgi:AcrR family transcriptional regulator
VTDLIESTRRYLTPRQAELVDRVVEAAVREVREHGYDGLTIRGAARSAGVAPATAYTYFASKDHVLAEILWRRLESLPPVAPDPALSALQRVTEELAKLGTFMAADPDVAAACTTALLGTGADVKELRDRFGSRIVSRIAAALGDDDGPVLQTLNLAYVGAMLSAGMGHLTFEEVPGAMATAAALVLGSPR